MSLLHYRPILYADNDDDNDNIVIMSLAAAFAVRQRNDWTLLAAACCQGDTIYFIMPIINCTMHFSYLANCMYVSLYIYILIYVLLCIYKHIIGTYRVIQRTCPPTLFHSNN